MGFSKDRVCLDSKKVGGKAKALAWLTRHGFRVPRWFVLTTDHFQHFLQENSLLKQTIESSLKALQQNEISAEQASRAIGEAFERATLSEAAIAELRKALEHEFGLQFETIELAVRSSIVDEDGEKHSFAGQMESSLFQKGVHDVAQSILRCYRSAYRAHALQYRTAHGMSVQSIAAAVVVQEMIDGEVSGVLFTAHPTLGSRGHALISANFGCCDGVVSGNSDCDEYTVDYLSGTIEPTIRRKENRAVKAESGRGIAYKPIPSELSTVSCLSDAQIRRVVDHGRAIADLKGKPQDIEWTFSKGELYVLQSRAITRLPAESVVSASSFVFDNSNIQESYCGITLPLTFSFASRSYFDVYRQVMKLVGFSENEVRKHDRRHYEMLGLIQGRVYYNINHWYQGLLLLPSFGKNKADMEKMMGLSEPVDFVEGFDLSFGQKIARLPKMVVVLSRLLLKFARIDRLVSQFENRFEQSYRQFSRTEFRRLNGRELTNQAETMRQTFLENWGIPIINDFYVMMMNGKVTRKLKKIGLEAELMNLLAGEDLASTGPTKELMAMAADIRASRTLGAIFETVRDEAVLETLASEDPVFYQRCQRFIENYGDRCIGELKLESISMREDPRFMFQVIRNYLKKPEMHADLLRDKELRLRAEAEVRVARAMNKKGKQSRAWKRFARDLLRLRKGVRYRESMRLARTRVFGLFRSLYLEVGQRLEETGVIQSARDVFYLTVEEIDSFYGAKAVTTRLIELIELRKREYAHYESDDAGHHLKTGVPVYERSMWKVPTPQVDPGSSQTLQGTGCFPGVVKKAVRLVKSPDENLDLEDHILCTVRTDPGWTPLFASISGLIVERGSTLSHSAVVARELGIPAIVGVPSVTEVLKDNEWVSMDGALGTVSRLESGPST